MNTNDVFDYALIVRINEAGRDLVPCEFELTVDQWKQLLASIHDTDAVVAAVVGPVAADEAAVALVGVVALVVPPWVVVTDEWGVRAVEAVVAVEHWKEVSEMIDIKLECGKGLTYL